ncbi:MAG TPA: hypothetical protein VGE41_06120, partial [Verrucomicrobiae bacterium]
GSCTMQTTVTGPGTLTFWWKVSSETNNDTLRFLVGGTEVVRISGEVGWEQRTYAIPAGSQTLAWTYKKNSNGIIGGQDKAWVDQVFFSTNGLGGFGLDGAGGTAPNQITAKVSFSGNLVDLSWEADPTKVYTVLYKEDLSSPDWAILDGEILLQWTIIGGDILVPGSVTATIEDIIGNQSRFYLILEYDPNVIYLDPSITPDVEQP